MKQQQSGSDLLYQLIVGDVPQIVVTTVSAILQKIIPRQQLCDYAELVMVGEDIDRDALVKKLIVRRLCSISNC